MKIKQVTEVDITFDNGNRIWFDHDQDCCEHNYADFNECVDSEESYIEGVAQFYINLGYRNERLQKEGKQ